MKKITLILLMLCSIIFGQNKPKIALCFIGEEPKKGVYKSLRSEMQKTIVKSGKYIDRTDLFTESQNCVINEAEQFEIDYFASIEISEIMDDYHLIAKMSDTKNSQIVEMSTANSKLENPKDVSIAAEEIVSGLLGTSTSVPDMSNYSSFIDSRNGKKYKTIKIGSITWMAENLFYSTGNSLCYKKDDFYCEKYGYLYDWETAMKACPSGWRLASQGEWNDLVQAAGGVNIAGKKLKSKKFWKGVGTDDLGFSALPGGRLIDGSFEGIDEYGNWWTASDDNSNAYLRFMGSNTDAIGENKRSKSRSYSVRCVQGDSKPKEIGDLSAATGKTIANASANSDNNSNALDNNANKQFKTVDIGRLTWMAENLNYETGKSWCYANDNFNCKKYGRLYDWNTAKKACPKGWHLPKINEWEDLIQSAGNKKESYSDFAKDIGEEYGKNAAGAIGGLVGAVAGKVAGKAVDMLVGEPLANKAVILKSKEWKGTDDLGFSALPSGGLNSKGFYLLDKGGAWWTATENVNDKNKAHDVWMISDSASIYQGVYNKSDAYSVRCVKDY